MTAPRFATFVFASLQMLFSTPSQGAEGPASGCIDDWSVAARIIKDEHLLTIEQLSAAAGEVFDGAIVRTTLCRENGTYVYQVVVRDRRGQLSRRRIEARVPNAR